MKNKKKELAGKTKYARFTMKDSYTGFSEDWSIMEMFSKFGFWYTFDNPFAAATMCGAQSKLGKLLPKPWEVGVMSSSNQDYTWGVRNSETDEEFNICRDDDEDDLEKLPLEILEALASMDGELIEI